MPQRSNYAANAQQKIQPKSPSKTHPKDAINLVLYAAMVIKGSGLVAVAVARSPVLSLADAAGGGSLLFRQLFDADTGTFTYLLANLPSSGRCFVSLHDG